LLSLVLLSCTDSTQPEYHHPEIKYLATENIDGTNLQIAGVQYYDEDGFAIEEEENPLIFFNNAVFTPDGSKLTNGDYFVNLDGSAFNSTVPENKRIGDFCFDSTGNNCFRIAHISGVYNTEIQCYNYNTNASETLIDSIKADKISISTDDNLLVVSQTTSSFSQDKVYIIDIASKTILKELNFISQSRKIFSYDNTELYYKDRLDESIKAINIETLQIRRLAPHGEISCYNENRTRFVYMYNYTCELLELDGDTYSYRTLSNASVYVSAMSINRAGTIALYKSEDGLIANYIDGQGEVLLRKNFSEAILSPSQEKYLFYDYGYSSDLDFPK
jgi:hypothetical protein